MSTNTELVYDQAWARAQELVTFRPTDLMIAASVGPTSAYRLIRLWERKGLIAQVSRDRIGRTFQIVGHPATTGDEQAVGTAIGNTWRAMRMLREFSAVDIAAHSTTEVILVTEQSVIEYCEALLRAGYIREVRRGGKLLYRLLRDTGPKPPRPQRVRGVIDPNTGEFTRLGGKSK